VAATVVLDAKTRKVDNIFLDRETFDRWYRGETVDTTVEGRALEEVGKLKALMNQQSRVLELLEKKLSPAQDQ